jgi:hypothetical protein
MVWVTSAQPGNIRSRLANIMQYSGHYFGSFRIRAGRSGLTKAAGLLGSMLLLISGCTDTRRGGLQFATATPGPSPVRTHIPEISGTVCEDVDKDSACGPGDHGVGGVKVVVWQYDDSSRRECALGYYVRDLESGKFSPLWSMTAPDGSFVFPGLSAGRYCVAQYGISSQGLVLSTPSPGSRLGVGPLDVSKSGGYADIDFAFLISH